MNQQVVNWSSKDIEVYGQNSTGAFVRWTLPSRRQSPADFDCHQVRATDGAEIFGTDSWWRIHTNYAFVYTFDTSLLFDDDLTLHCVPFRPSGGPNGPWQRGYEMAAADPARDNLPLSTVAHRPPEHPVSDPDTELGQSLGELKAIEFSGDVLWLYDFGIQVRTRMNLDVYISVRVRTAPHSNLSAADLRRWNDHDSNGENQRDRWKRLVEQTWNNPALPTASPNHERLHFELDWDGPCRHYEIDVLPPGRELLKQKIGSSTIYWWEIDCDDRTTSSGTIEDGPTSAHEFGHYLGLQDGYLYPMEVALYDDEPKIADLLDPAKNPNLKAKRYTGRVRKQAEFFSSLLRFLPSVRSRHRERMANGPRTPPGDIMDDQYFPGAGMPSTPQIDQRLIDCILNRQVQTLLYGEWQFLKNP